MRMDKLLHYVMSPVPSLRVYWLLFFVTVFQLGPSPAKAQNYPSKSVKIVVPSAPGGGTDIVGRLLAQSFTKAFNQSFFVENKPGAGNLIGIEAVANAPADGYTLLFVPSTLVLNPILYKKVNYDPIKDFSPISLFINKLIGHLKHVMGQRTNGQKSSDLESALTDSKDCSQLSENHNRKLSQFKILIS